MAQKESRRSRDIMNALRAEGWFCFKVHGSETMMAGLPDIICCAEGYFFGLETKNPDGDDATPIQKHIHGKIRAAGGTAQVVRSPEEAVHVVRTALANFRSC